MISEVLLISKPRSDKSCCFGISWCFRFLLLGVLEEFENSFVAENSNNLVNMNNQSWFVTDALRLCRIGTYGLVIIQHGKIRVTPSLWCLQWDKGQEWAGSVILSGFQGCLVLGSLT